MKKNKKKGKKMKNEGKNKRPRLFDQITEK